MSFEIFGQDSHHNLIELLAKLHENNTPFLLSQYRMKISTLHNHRTPNVVEYLLLFYKKLPMCCLLLLCIIPAMIPLIPVCCLGILCGLFSGVSTVLSGGVFIITVIAAALYVAFAQVVGNLQVDDTYMTIERVSQNFLKQFGEYDGIEEFASLWNGNNKNENLDLLSIRYSPINNNKAIVAKASCSMSLALDTESTSDGIYYDYSSSGDNGETGQHQISTELEESVNEFLMSQFTFMNSPSAEENVEDLSSTSHHINMDGNASKLDVYLTVSKTFSCSNIVNEEKEEEDEISNNNIMNDDEVEEPKILISSENIPSSCKNAFAQAQGFIHEAKMSLEEKDKKDEVLIFGEKNHPLKLQKKSDMKCNSSIDEKFED